MLEKCYEHNITLHNMYVDYIQALSVDKKELLNCFILLGIPLMMIKLVEMTIKDS